MLALVLLLCAAAHGYDGAKSKSTAWAPPDIDRVFTPVNVDVPCALGAVMREASRRVEESVVNMQRFSATEDVTFEEMDPHGGVRAKKANFSYVANIKEVGPQQLAVEEYRNDMLALQDFPSRLATLGTAAFALIFHPHYLKDFAVTCEGLSEWQGRRAWRLHLAQVKANNFRGYRLANRYFPVKLKVRAWIDAETFEVLRLETDLRDPIPEIPLLLEHVIVDYAMVEFPRRKVRLWLPRDAEIYMDYRGRQYHHRHSFSHFQLFWVETDQTVKAPQVAIAEPVYPAANVTEPVVEPAVAQQNAPSGPQPETPTVNAKPAAEPSMAWRPAGTEQAAFAGNAFAETTKPAATRAPANTTPAEAATQSSTFGPTPGPVSNVIANSLVEPHATASLAGSTAPGGRQGCPDCIRVLISQRDLKTGRLKDDLPSPAQEAWLQQNAEQLIKDKGAKVRVTPRRAEAQYNIIWSVAFAPGVASRTMRAEVKVHEVASGKELFNVAHESQDWEADHPETTCLQEAIAFLQSGPKSSRQ